MDRNIIHDDAENGPPVTMVVDRGPYGIDVDCYKEGIKEPIATVHIDYFDNKIRVLYWDETVQQRYCDDPLIASLVSDVKSAIESE